MEANPYQQQIEQQLRMLSQTCLQQFIGVFTKRLGTRYILDESTDNMCESVVRLVDQLANMDLKSLGLAQTIRV